MRNVLLGGNKERRGEINYDKCENERGKKKKKKETGENVNHAHGLLEGTIKLVDQIHGERREWRESV